METNALKKTSVDQTLDLLDKNITEKAVDIALELTKNTLPDEFKQHIHSLWVKDLMANGFEKLGKLKVVDDVKVIKLKSAFALKNNESTDIQAKINKILAKDLAIKVEIDLELIAGIVIEIGNLVLDSSLKNKLTEQSILLENKNE